MFPVLFRIGGFSVYTYGVLFFIGIVSAYAVSHRAARKENIPADVFSDIIFWTIISGMLGARIVYILVEYRYFLIDPIGALLSRSGFIFYGGIIFGGTAFYFLVKKRGFDFFKIADVAALGIPLGHAIGRLGCFFYGCCYGRPTVSWVGMLFPSESPAGAAGVKVIPTQLISSAVLFIIFFIILYVKKKRKFDGQVFLTYLILYGLSRFVIEFFRGDPRGFILGISTSQAIAAFVILSALFVWRKRAREC